LKQSEITRVQNYMRRKFGLDTLRVVARAQKDDSAEVMIGDEFIGIIFRDDEDGEVSYQFNMAILDIDLDEPM
jgi:hypothetical protein